MPKIAHDLLSGSEQRKLEKELSFMLRSLEKEGLLIAFMEHALMPSERVMLARRTQIARRLVQGQTLAAIQRDLKVGQRTIENVHRWLLAFPEYRRQLPAALRDARKGDRGQNEIPYTFAWVRKKYPLHFLLINLVLRGDPQEKE